MCELTTTYHGLFGLTIRLRPPYVSDKGYAQAAQDEVDDTV